MRPARPARSAASRRKPRRTGVPRHAAVETVLDDAGGVVTRVGDETVGEMWSLCDGQDVLNEIDPSLSANIPNHGRRAALLDPFHASRNPRPTGDPRTTPA